MRVEFSPAYVERVRQSRGLIEKFLEENRLIYGVTTRFGDNVREVISPEDAETLQRNIVLSHACSVGEPLNRESVRAIQLMWLLSLGKGFSGVRIETLDLIAQLLNLDVTPYAPGDGSVGYLAVEAHIALVLIGEGRAWYQGRLLVGGEALAATGLKPITLKCKEGLTVTNGANSVTALAALAVYDAVRAATTADIAGAMAYEALKGTIRACDARYHSVKAHAEQAGTARNILKILQDSEIAESSKDLKVQDAYALRCVPQMHGAAKNALKHSLVTILDEMNSCSDNPHFNLINDILFTGEPEQPGDTHKSLLFFGRDQFDRSPCGTGTCARMGVLYARGLLSRDETFRHESIIGTIFEGRVGEEKMVGEYRAVTPYVRSRGFLTGMGNLIIDSEDSLAHGFSLRS